MVSKNECFSRHPLLFHSLTEVTDSVDIRISTPCDQITAFVKKRCTVITTKVITWHLHPDSSFIYVFPLSVFSGGWSHHAPDSLDAPREHHVQEILYGKRRLELRSHLVGDLHLREAALVPALQQRGTE